MCGICGKVEFDERESANPALIRGMLHTIAHRGPDGEGIHISGPAGLGHRRLAIIDLDTGQQPLSNEDGSIWIVFNGEIYNYHELRQELAERGHVFRTKSDTEVIVHLYEEYGGGCVEKLRGMFAFAVWDGKNHTLVLARDRVGIKPLYYAVNGRSLVFGSEIKAILADPEVDRQVLPAMVDRFLTFQYLPGEETLFRSIRKLAPGSYMVLRGGRIETRKYWDLDFTPVPRSVGQAAEELLALLEESVRIHMISDVPVGFLLSGGVDSTAVLGLAAGRTDHAVSSYTLGFSAEGIIDERPYAQLAARTYGSEHHELTISWKEFRDFLPAYVWHMEEPVCEPPAVALFYVSRLAKAYVKVLLSGEGGDEAFAGYQNYRSTVWLERLKRALGPLRAPASVGLLQLNRALRLEKVGKYAPLLRVPFDSYYHSRTSSPLAFFNRRSNWLYSADFAQYVDSAESLRPLRSLLDHASGYSVLNKMLYIDTKTWLTDDLLVKADKMTMANSVELRVPLLDHKVLEFAASLPENHKVRGFTTKFILKKVLGQRVPQPILNRRKTGFPVPYASWLRREMREWLVDLLLDRETLARGYFNRQAIEFLLSESAASGRYAKELFCLAALELWHRAFVGRNDIVPDLAASLPEDVAIRN